MIQKIIRRIAAGCLTVGMGLLCGCANHEDAAQKTGETTQLLALPFAFSSSGVLKVETETDRVQFYDFTSEQTVYLCNKAGCTHDTEDCGAYMERVRYAFYYNDSLYLVQGGEELQELILYQANRYGEERTKRAVIEAGIVSYSAEVVEDSLCFIGYQFDMEEKTSAVNFYAVDLNSGEITKVEPPDLDYSLSQVEAFLVTEDACYFVCYYTDFSYGEWDEETQQMQELDMSDFSLHAVLYKMDRNSGEFSTVLETDSDCEYYSAFLQEDRQKGTFLVQWGTQVLEIDQQTGSSEVVFTTEEYFQVVLVGDYEILIDGIHREGEEISVYREWEFIKTLPAEELQMCYGTVDRKVIFIKDMQLMYLDYDELEQDHPTIHFIDL